MATFPLLLLSPFTFPGKRSIHFGTDGRLSPPVVGIADSPSLFAAGNRFSIHLGNGGYLAPRLVFRIGTNEDLLVTRLTFLLLVPSYELTLPEYSRC